MTVPVPQSFPKSLLKAVDEVVDFQRLGSDSVFASVDDVVDFLVCFLLVLHVANHFVDFAECSVDIDHTGFVDGHTALVELDLLAERVGAEFDSLDVELEMLEVLVNLFHHLVVFVLLLLHFVDKLLLFAEGENLETEVVVRLRVLTSFNKLVLGNLATSLAAGQFVLSLFKLFIELLLGHFELFRDVLLLFQVSLGVVLENLKSAFSVKQLVETVFHLDFAEVENLFDEFPNTHVIVSFAKG